MNLRKFYLILTSIMTSFLFIFGIGLLLLVNTSQAAPKDNSAKPKKNIITDIIEPFVADKNPVNILVLGGDKVAGNTDTIMLVNFTPATAQLNILSLPRDSRVKIEGLGYTKVNAAYPKGGADLAVQTVSNFLGVKIKYHVYVDTSAFRKVIDTLDGIDYEVPVDMNYDDPIQNLHIHFQKGLQHMDGEKAEEFMRFRHPTHYTKEIMKYYDGSDLKRIDAQQSFIKELLRQKTNIKYISKINEIIDVIFKSVETNITSTDALKLSQNIGNLNVSAINTFKVPGRDLNVYTWYYVPDIEETKRIVEQYFYSESGVAPTEYTNVEDAGLREMINGRPRKNPSNSGSNIKGSATPKP